MKGAIQYRGEWLAKGSTAQELHEAVMKAAPRERNEAKAKLHRHLAAVHAAAVARGEVCNG